MGLLDFFTMWSEKRLRLSQIKILYQNQAALEFIGQEMAPGAAINSDEAVAMSRDLDLFRLLTENAIVDLSIGTILPDEASKEMFQINKDLRYIYSGLSQGKQAFKVMMRSSAGESTPFEKRFMPAVGWEKFDDHEWDQMIFRALERHK